MTLTHLTGFIRFKVGGQDAIPKWQQTAIRSALDALDSPPEELRFQCRIATDARVAFANVELDDGNTLTLHSKARPQFGKNVDGHAYLTATMVYSGDGQAYTFRWVGEGVPLKMQEVAVKHDKGLAVKPVTIALDMAKAQIAPAWAAHAKGGPSAVTRDYKAETLIADERKAKGKPKIKRSPRTCARLTDADLAAV